MTLDFESALALFCAPTLADIKPAGLFRFTGFSQVQVRREVREWDARFADRGIRVRVLKQCPDEVSCLVYVYRPNRLWQILARPEIGAFLAAEGYEEADPEGRLEQLMERLREREEFPHEIGVFLGYPLEDVVGFIENEGRNYTCLGCWKAYGDPGKAQAYFTLCRQCTELYCRSYEQGVSPLHLAVAA